MADDVFEYNIPLDELDSILGGGGESAIMPSTTIEVLAPEAEDTIGYLDTRNIGGMATEALQGATFGLGNKATAGILSALGYGDYEDIRASQDAARAEYARQAPYFSGAANLAGGFVIPTGGALNLAAKGVARAAPSVAKLVPRLEALKPLAEKASAALVKPSLLTGGLTGATDAALTAVGEGGTVEDAIASGILGAGVGAVGGGVSSLLQVKKAAGTAAEKELANRLLREGYDQKQVAGMLELAREAKGFNIPASIADIESMPSQSSLPLKKTGVFRRAQNVAQVAEGAQAQASEAIDAKRLGALDRIRGHLNTLSQDTKSGLSRDDLAGFYAKVTKAAENAKEGALEDALYKEVYGQYGKIKPSAEANKIFRANKAKAAAERAEGVETPTVKVKPPAEVEKDLIVNYIRSIKRGPITQALEKAKSDEVAAGRSLSKVMLEPRFWGKVRGQLNQALAAAEKATASDIGHDVQPATIKKAISYLDKKLDFFTEGEHAKSRKLLATTMQGDPAVYSPQGLIQTIAQQDASKLKGPESVLHNIFGPKAKFEQDVDDLVRVIGNKETRAAAKVALMGQMPTDVSRAKATPILNNEATMKQLKKLLSPEDYKLLEKKLLFEKAIETNISRLQGGSDTAAKLVEEDKSLLKTILTPVKTLQGAFNYVVNEADKRIMAQRRREVADLLLNPDRTIQGLQNAQALMAPPQATTASRMAQRVAESLARTTPTRIVITPRG